MDDAFLKAVATRVGYSPDQIIDTGDPGYRLVDANFQLEVVAEIENYPWKWNTQDKVFLPTAPVVGEGQEQYQGIVTVDDGLVRIEKVHQYGNDLRYDRMNQTLLIWNYSEDEDITVRGQWYCEPQLWPEMFRKAMRDKLASILAGSLMLRMDVAQYLEQAAEASLLKLKTSDSQQQTTPRVRGRRIAARRRTPYTSPGAPRGKADGT